MRDLKAVGASRETLAGFVARKQGLGRERDAGVAEMAAQAFGFYGTAPTCHLSFLARLPSYRALELDRAVAEDRSVVRLRAMRKTLFLVARTDYAVVHVATRTAYRAYTDQLVRRAGLTSKQAEAARRSVTETLRGGPRSKAEIRKHARLPESKVPLLDVLMHALAAEGVVVRARSTGGWRSDVVEYALTEEWLPGIDVDALTTAEAQAALARRYLESFGPATEDDFRWWSGLPRAEAAAAIAALRRELVSVRGEALARGLLVLAPEADALRRAEPLPGAHMLPIWDGYLMAYRDRGRYLDPERSAAVFDRSGNGTSTLWLDGAIAGIWDFAIAKRTIEIKVAPFRKLAKARWRAVREEAERIAALAGANELVLLDCGSPPPLDAGIDPDRKGYVGPGQNRFRSPLAEVAGRPSG